MAKIVNNDKGFRVISLSAGEAQILGFGIYNSGLCVCSNCGRYISDSSSTDIPPSSAVENEVISDIYYIAVLDDVMGRGCYDRWYKGAKRYTEDIPVEDRNFNYYKEALGL